MTWKIDLWSVWVVNKMKPLSPNKIQNFLSRFDNFKSGEFRSVEIISPTSIHALFAVQDANREHDWITVELEFTGVFNANLPQKSQLSLINMNNGVTLLTNDNKLAFGVGEYSTFASVENSLCCIYCSQIKYQEGLF